MRGFLIVGGWVAGGLLIGDNGRDLASVYHVIQLIWHGATGITVIRSTGFCVEQRIDRAPAKDAGQ
jgi:hypothetical protein